MANPTPRFFFHEHARKIGIWAWAFVISPYLGPFLSAIISNYKPWRTSFWIDFLIVGLALAFVTFLGTHPPVPPSLPYHPLFPAPSHIIPRSIPPIPALSPLPHLQ